MTGNSDKYGSARWCDSKELAAEGIATGRTLKDLAGSFLLGETADTRELLKGIRKEDPDYLRPIFATSRLAGGSYLGWKGGGHILTVAPTRSGKGVGMVIPNLLHYSGSVLVVDPKGENYAVTQRHRKDNLGQDIVCLDPFGAVSSSCDSINPFDILVANYSAGPANYLKHNPELLDDASMIADALVVREADEHEPHWNDKCRTLLKGLILAVACGHGPKKHRHLSEVRSLLTSGQSAFIKLLADMRKDTAAIGGHLSRASNEIQSMGTEELKNVVSYALKHTEFLDSPLVDACLGDEYRTHQHGSYDLMDLKKFGKVSIYMILPPRHLARYNRLLRLWMTMALAAMTKTKDKPKNGSVLFMLDEMAQLGTLDILRQSVSLLAGYGMTLWMIWQDISQIKALYERDWTSFIANAKIQQYFGVNDHETAKMVSEMIGDETLTVSTMSTGSNRGGLAIDFTGLTSSTSRNQSESLSEKDRALLAPDEMRRLNREAVIMFVQGLPPVAARRLTYHTNSELNLFADKNPYL